MAGKGWFAVGQPWSRPVSQVMPTNPTPWPCNPGAQLSQGPRGAPGRGRPGRGCVGEGVWPQLAVLRRYWLTACQAPRPFRLSTTRRSARRGCVAGMHISDWLGGRPPLAEPGTRGLADGNGGVTAIGAPGGEAGVSSALNARIGRGQRGGVAHALKGRRRRWAGGQVGGQVGRQGARQSARQAAPPRCRPRPCRRS